MEKTDKKIEQEMAAYKGEVLPIERTLSRKTSIELMSTFDAFLVMFETRLAPDYLEEKKRLMDKVRAELYPALYDNEINLEQFF